MTTGKNSKKIRFVIGVDEVGRGSLAGMVTVAAIAMPKSLIIRELGSRIISNNNFGKRRGIPLRDSKRLTKKQREEWFRYIKNHPRIFYKAANVSPRIIERINISRAANRGAASAVARLIDDYRLPVADCEVFLDGGLFANSPRLRTVNLKFKTIVRGDEKIPAVALASIVAKVLRDKKMRNLHKNHPEYDFINNVGYGTRKHIKALREFGPTALHRLTFIKKYSTLNKNHESNPNHISNNLW